jgi:hypothetical protein
MTETIQRVEYFYTQVQDKPGEGARVLQVFARAQVNLLAFSGFPHGRRAQLDFVPTDQAAFKAAAKAAKIKLVGPKTAFLIQGEDRVGAIAEIIGKLARAKINVTALDAVASGQGRFGAILWVNPRQTARAASLLGAG